MNIFEMHNIFIEISRKYKSDINQADYSALADDILVHYGVSVANYISDRFKIAELYDDTGKAFNSLLDYTSFEVVDDVVYGEHGKILYKYDENKKDTSFTIPKSVTHICTKAFSNNKHIEELYWGGAKSTDCYIFEGCYKLKSVFVDNWDDFVNSSFDIDGTPLLNGANLYVSGVMVEVIDENMFSKNPNAFKGCPVVDK